ncbi:hypothetical protein ACJW31_11G121600 [Castanea mollissima]
MSVIGEAALSGFFQVLFSKLTSPELLEFLNQDQVQADLKKWKTMLLKIRAVLDDAEEKQMTSRAVKIWLDELRDLAFDVEDVLDKFATEALQHKLNAEHSTSKEPMLIPAGISFNPTSVMFNTNMRSKIKEINTRLQESVTQKNYLELRYYDGGRTKTARLPTTSLVNEGHVYGRDEDKKAIVNLLLGAGSSDSQLSVIPIIAMGGMGKTTLAQLVYNDHDVNRHFNMKAWIYVSDDFDIVRVTKAIIQSVTSEPYDVNDLDLLQVKLKNILFGKKFLFILDDVWNENYNNWTVLQRPFEFGALGSKVVVTTRNDGVSSLVGTTPSYKLKELSPNACLHVFTQHALGATDFSEHLELQEIGQKIIEMCKGLPLVAKELGGHLRTKHNHDQWKNVLYSNIRDIPEEKSAIIPTLRLSYQYLPSQLKRCFAYCSIFPKAYEFEEKELVLLWMAEGLLQETEGNKQMEDLGSEYFLDLLGRSFFQQSSNHASRCVMHDLVNDLAQWAAGDICYRLDDKLNANNQSKIPTKVRYFSYIPCFCDGIKRFEDFHEGMSLRTFLPLPERKVCYLTNHVSYHMLPQLKCLRVLSLSGYQIVELSSSIGDLKHLRYLNLSGTLITSLPESISSLYNLQTLILRRCFKLTRLPKKIGNLVNLRHLDTTDAYLIKEMPVGLKNLKSLQTLPEFVVGKDTGSKVGDLMNLKFLRKILCISGLENVLNAEDARKAGLNGKNLDVLVMKWGSVLIDLLDARVAIDVLDMLQPPITVKELSIKGYVGARFPTWLGDPLFSKLVLLKMSSCEKCTSLPAIGQLPSLKDLVIIGMAGVRSVGSEFYGDGFFNPFRSLVRLRFEDMQEWQDWIPCGVKYEEFPCLHELSIIKCPKLQGKLPHHLPSLEKISIHKCEQLVVSIPNLPMLHEVEIVGCKEVISKSPIELSSLKSMEFMQGSTKVEYVAIDDCKELTSLWQDRLISLVTLDIRSCPRLVNISLPYTLRTMKIKNCNALKSLPMSNSMCIETAYIDNCHSLTCISRGQLPPTLRRLDIKNCENLQVVLDEEEASSSSSSSSLARNEGNLYVNCSSNESLLEHLEIRECSSLKCLSSKNQFPAALKNLFVYKCPELESVTKELKNNASLEHFQICHCEKLKSLPEGLHRLCHLYVIKIWDCSSLVSFPDGGLLPTSLRKLSIENCEKLEALPNCLPNLTYLQELVICRCPSIISFTEVGYPTNLTSLWLSGVNICKQLFEWGIHRLTSLRDLNIMGGFPNLQSFPEAEEDGKTMMMLLLPISLTSLSIINFPNLVLLSKGFQHLSALEMLYIKDCPKLEYLPENGLPPSLLKLYIYRCPLLEQHCKKGKGREWFKIANIPRVEIDWRSVYEVEEEQE